MLTWTLNILLSVSLYLRQTVNICEFTIIRFWWVHLCEQLRRGFLWCSQKCRQENHLIKTKQTRKARPIISFKYNCNCNMIWRIMYTSKCTFCSAPVIKIISSEPLDILLKVFLITEYKWIIKIFIWLAKLITYTCPIPLF